MGENGVLKLLFVFELVGSSTFLCRTAFAGPPSRVSPVSVLIDSDSGRETGNRSALFTLFREHGLVVLCDFPFWWVCDVMMLGKEYLFYDGYFGTYLHRNVAFEPFQKNVRRSNAPIVWGWKGYECGSLCWISEARENLHRRWTKQQHLIGQDSG